MDTTLSQPLEPIVPIFPVKRFTADQYLEMIRAGIFTEDDHVELIDGVITEMAPSGPNHSWGVQKLNRLFRPAEETHFVFIQGTVCFGDRHVFDPDVSLVKLSASLEDPVRHPRGDEVDLVVEVADSSIKRDREVKAKAYAEAKVGEYWVVDLKRRLVWVHRDPVDGEYLQISSTPHDGELTPLAFPAMTISVTDLLGR